MVRRGIGIRVVLLLSLIAIVFPSFNPPQPVKAVTPYPPPGSKVWAIFEDISTGNDAVYGVAVDSSGNVYVADTNNNRVQLFGDAVLRFWVA